MTTILNGDCLDVLKTLPDESVHCVVTSPPYWGLRSYLPADHPDKHKEIGTEKTPEEYVAKMVAVFKEVRRVLRKDGTCWVNLGDSYATTSGGWQQVAQTNTGAGLAADRIGAGKIPSIKPKDLVGIPFRVAFALQADGWWLRQDIIWAKPNPMPESVTDRCTKNHEYIFLLTKSANYYYDSIAIQEEKACWRARGKGRSKHNYDRNDNGDMAHFANKDLARGIRNRRSVWTVATQPYNGSHFAVFPEKLIEPMILAGCPAQCCPVCGKGWERVVERKASTSKRHTRLDCPQSHHPGQVPHRVGGFNDAECRTLGFRPSCACPPADPVPGVTLDPFGGSGTTGQVASRLGRKAILIELNPKYLPLVNQRTAQAGLNL